MRVYRVESISSKDFEKDIPLNVQLSVQEDLANRQQRLVETDNSVSFRLAELREEYKEEIAYLVGPENMRKHAGQYKELIERLSKVPVELPQSPDGEKEKAALRERLKTEKHELYHSIGFDTKRAIAIRKKYLKRANEILGPGISIDAHMPYDDDAELPKPTNNPWTWIFPPYSGRWTHLNTSSGSRGARWHNRSASSTSGSVSLWSRMDLFGADDSDFSRIDAMAEVGFWFRMPAAGLVEMWVWYQDTNTDYSGHLWDESGCSDANVQQLSRGYLWTSGSTERYSNLYDFRRGESEGGWARGGPAMPGQILTRHFVSHTVYPAGRWVWVAAGIRDMNYFWVDDMSCRSIMRSHYFVHHVAVRSTGAP